MRERQKLRDIFAVLAIATVWFAVLSVGIIVTVLGDCFEPGCGADKDNAARIVLWVVAIGFVATVAAYFFRKRRAKGD